MEKFSKFRDAATGIAPFQTLKKPLTEDSALDAVLQTALGVLLFPIVVGSLIWYFLVFQWIPVAGQLFLHFVVLRSLRLFYTSLAYDGERRVTVRKRLMKRAQPGDVLISNFVSPLDPLVYAAFYKAVFIFPAESGFVKQSLFGAIGRALTVRPAPTKSAQAADIIKDAVATGSVIVLFAEGTTSNGKGLLPLGSVDFRSLAVADNSVYVSAIKYTPATAASPTPVSLFGYIWRLTSSAWWYMVSIKVSGEPLAKSVITKEGVSKALANVGRLRQVGPDLDITAKREFIKAYENMRSH